ncbi:hypothetical protein RSAG8_04759, partial [Rhizoctonia solani AG-8 WAC10335]
MVFPMEKKGSVSGKSPGELNAARRVMAVEQAITVRGRGRERGRGAAGRDIGASGGPHGDYGCDRGPNQKPGCVALFVRRAEVRLLSISTTMAFYISQPKVRQAGFELPNKQDEERQASPTYDPSMYFAHNNFGSPFDAFNRLKYDNHSNVDFTDTLATMVSVTRDL